MHGRLRAAFALDGREAPGPTPRVARLSQIRYNSATMTSTPRKQLYWIASSRKDLKGLPVAVQKKFGTALLDVQYGETPTDAKRLKGFAGAGVLEIVEDYQTDTYRAVYTVNFADAVYVLHVFQKKSKRGIATPKRDMDLIRSRYELARQHHAELLGRKDEERNA
jgi:phage-related protein